MWRSAATDGNKGRQLGDVAFLERLELLTGSTLKPVKRGPKSDDNS